MTANRSFKRRVRDRAARTGESYTAALRHLRPAGPAGGPPPRVRLAVAQSPVCEDPSDAAALRSSGAGVRELMRQAHAAGARVVQFTEGATCFPGKRVMSGTGPGTVGPADWDRFAWPVLREELTAVAELAGRLRLWTVLGSTHRLTPPHRPHNCLYVIGDRGRPVTRYDERMLSHTKVSCLYSPGTRPAVFTVDGVRFGLALGMESHFPEVFAEYERLDVDCVLFSTTGAPAQSGVFALETLAHAAVNGYWTGFAVPCGPGGGVPAGIAAPGGTWAARCPDGARPAIALADVGRDPADPAVGLARPWRRTARAGRYAAHVVEGDSRSDLRTSF